jgi:ribosomal-protein-alanine N-acetyltransferase
MRPTIILSKPDVMIAKCSERDVTPMWSAPDTMETARLIGERIRPEHLEEFYRLHRDPRVMKTLSVDGEPLPDEQSQQSLQRQIDRWEHEGLGLWIWHDREDGHFVGRGGLQRDPETGIELGYAVMADDWGKGYATEIGAASLRVGFEDLGLTEIVCFTLPVNIASQRVMQKLGFVYEHDFVHAGLPHVFYRLTAEQWRAAQGDPASA